MGIEAALDKFDNTGPWYIFLPDIVKESHSATVPPCPAYGGGPRRKGKTPCHNHIRLQLVELSLYGFGHPAPRHLPQVARWEQYRPGQFSLCAIRRGKVVRRATASNLYDRESAIPTVQRRGQRQKSRGPTGPQIGVNKGNMHT